MLKIYLDSDYICHSSNIGNLREYITDFFDENTPEKFIDGYRIVPDGEIWIREDGVTFQGEMVAPAINYEGLKKVQEQYQIDDEKHTQELGELINEIYAEDLEFIG